MMGDVTEMKFQAAIFDMDGTVLDTIRDLRDAVNYAMKETGHRHDFTDDDTKMLFGSGVYVALSRALIAEKLGVSAEDDGVLDRMLEVGFTTGPEDYGIPKEEVERISTVYRPYYEKNCDIHTKPYDGIGALLTRLRRSGVKTAVVSNKPDEAVRTLSADKFPDQFDFVLGEQPGIRRKPEPDMTDRQLLNIQTRQYPLLRLHIKDTQKKNVPLCASLVIPCTLNCLTAIIFLYISNHLLTVVTLQLLFITEMKLPLKRFDIFREKIGLS